MEKIIIAAVADNGVIGIENRLPWDLPADRRLFRELTTGHTVIMGRRTFEAIGGPLPDRQNIVVSSTLRDHPGITVCPDFDGALSKVNRGAEKVFFIGGTSIYRRALAVADRMYLSRVHGNIPGDTFFPDFDQEEWKICRRQEYGGFELQVLSRRGRPPS